MSSYLWTSQATYTHLIHSAFDKGGRVSPWTSHTPVDTEPNRDIFTPGKAVQKVAKIDVGLYFDYERPEHVLSIMKQVVEILRALEERLQLGPKQYLKCTVTPSQGVGDQQTWVRLKVNVCTLVNVADTAKQYCQAGGCDEVRDQIVTCHEHVIVGEDCRLNPRDYGVIVGTAVDALAKKLEASMRFHAEK